MADDPTRGDTPPPPARPPEPPGLQPSPEFQQKLDAFRAQKEAKQNAGQLVDHRAAKAGNPAENKTEQVRPPQQRAGDGSASVDRQGLRDPDREPPGLQPSPEFQQKLDAFRAQKEAKQNAGEQPSGGKSLDPAPEVRRASAVDDGATQSSRRPDETPETTKRLAELRTEGHAPQRHYDPADNQLIARLGSPSIDPETSKARLTGSGFVETTDKVDPATGSKQDIDHPDKPHTCGPIASRFDSGSDMIAADRYFRREIGDSPVVTKTAPIADVLGPDAHKRMTGFYLDPENPSQIRKVDFEGGTIFARYERGADGELRLRTMYPKPVPFRPNELDGNGS